MTAMAYKPPTTLGQALKHFRRRKGYGRAELGQMAQVSEGTITRMENDENVGIYVIEAVCRKLGVSLEEVARKAGV